MRQYVQSYVVTKHKTHLKRRTGTHNTALNRTGQSRTDLIIRDFTSRQCQVTVWWVRRRERQVCLFICDATSWVAWQQMVQDERGKLSAELPWQKQQWNKKKTVLSSQLDLTVRKKPVKCYIWGTSLCGAETWTFREGQKYMESCELRCWRMIEKINLTDRVRSEEVLQRLKEERNILHIV
jgi:hypothetical protein